jgi:hypothetical protein
MLLNLPPRLVAWNIWVVGRSRQRNGSWDSRCGGLLASRRRHSRSLDTSTEVGESGTTCQPRTICARLRRLGHHGFADCGAESLAKCIIRASHAVGRISRACWRLRFQGSDGKHAVCFGGIRAATKHNRGLVRRKIVENGACRAWHCFHFVFGRVVGVQ